MPRRPSGRSVKRHRSYTVDEAARTTGVAKGTVRRWIKTGLPVLNEQRPALIIGRELIEYLEARKPKKRELAIQQSYCFSCRAPREPAFGEVEIQPAPNGGGMMISLCGTCSTVMHKRIPAGSLSALKAKATVTIRQDHERINEGSKPCLNDHFEQGSQTHAKAPSEKRADQAQIQSLS